MADIVLTNASVVVNSVDLSAHVTSVAINRSADAVETTAMGDTARTYTGGLESGTLDITFNQDYASAKVEATLYGLVNTSTTVVVKPTASAVAATNPSYTMSCFVAEYSPVDGSVGDLSTVNLSWPINGAIVKATS
tara:strand:- start:313 stop:720 length:408 start_codon:yes stop_codon:yes gene_type:complete